MWSQSIDLWGLEMTVYQLMVLVAFVALVLGYLLAVLVNRRHRSAGGPDGLTDKERLASNAAFMKGINYILSEKRDQAIEELTRAVTLDTDTVETYVALGHLFRSKGEIDRAIRIRQSIILRPNLDEKIRVQALYDLGLDYHQGGFFDRAIQTFEEVIKSDPKRTAAYLQLIQIYEETRDWEKAFEMEQKVAGLTGSRAGNILAHHQVELAKVFIEKGRPVQAKAAYKKALSLDPGCVDAYLHLGDMQLQEGKPKKAMVTWRKVAGVAPDLSFLVFGRLARAHAEMKDLKPVEKFLADCAISDRNPLAHLALAHLLAERGDEDRALEELAKALVLDPDLFEARREMGLLLLSLGRTEEALENYHDFLSRFSAPEADFQCGRCGFKSKELMWRCPQCHGWDTMTLHRHYPLLFKRDISKPAEAPPPAAQETKENNNDTDEDQA